MQMILSCQSIESEAERCVSSGIKVLRKQKSLMFKPFPLSVGIDASPATSNSAKLIFALRVHSSNFFTSSTLKFPIRLQHKIMEGESTQATQGSVTLLQQYSLPS